MTSTRAKRYAELFAAVNDEAIAIVTGCSDEQWRHASAAEGWTVAAVSHHIGEVNGAFARIVTTLAAGGTYTPTVSMEAIHESNARHARDYAAAGRQETLNLLRANGAAIIQSLERVSDDALFDRVAGVFGGNELTVAQVIEYVVIGHTAEHAASIRATIAS